MTSMTTLEFIKRSIKKHGNLYDYSKSIFISSDTKIEIICKNHGSFFQKPYDHFKHNGCSACGKSGREKITYSVFMKMIYDLYSNIDYSMIEYKSYIEKIKLRCVIHDNIYWQVPKFHVHYANGCSSCRRSKQRKTRTNGYDKNAYKLYYDEVKRATYKSYKEHSHIINPKKLKRGRTKASYHLDHIYSISEGLKNGISAKIIGHWTNLRMLKSSDNVKKNYRSDKSIKQLLEDYNRENCK